MQKNTYRYEQTAARLLVEGYPDLSLGQPMDAIGILSGWRMQLVAAPELQGTREHLEALMAVVMPYARHLLSGVERPFASDGDVVTIEPAGSQHQLLLRSSQDGIEPLRLTLDDAELSDLVRCLDQLRLDQRVQLNWQLAENRPLARQELVEKIPLQRRLGAPVLGGLALISVVAAALVLPLPPLQEKPAATPVQPSGEPAAAAER
jgi:hypothetical protein